MKTLTVVTFLALLLTGCTQEFKAKQEKSTIENLLGDVKCIDGVYYFVSEQKVTSVKINKITLRPEVCEK